MQRRSQLCNYEYKENKEVLVEQKIEKFDEYILIFMNIGYHVVQTEVTFWIFWIIAKTEAIAAMNEPSGPWFSLLNGNILDIIIMYLYCIRISATYTSFWEVTFAIFQNFTIAQHTTIVILDIIIATCTLRLT